MMERASVMGVVGVVVGVVIALVMGGCSGEVKSDGAAMVSHDSTILQAERRELEAVKKVYVNLMWKEGIVAISPEFLDWKHQWACRLAGLEMRLASDKYQRLKVAQDFLAAMRNVSERVHHADDAGLIEKYMTEAYVAEGEVLMERVKSGDVVEFDRAMNKDGGAGLPGESAVVQAERRQLEAANRVLAGVIRKERIVADAGVFGTEVSIRAGGVWD